MQRCGTPTSLTVISSGKSRHLSGGRVALEACDTSPVTYHETFWVVTGAEAPVVALAVIVQLTDTVRTMEQDRAQFWAKNDRWRYGMQGAILVCVLNLALMGWLLFSSLSSLATGADSLSTGFATVQAVIGLGLLLFAYLGIFAVRETAQERHRAEANSGEDEPSG